MQICELVDVQMWAFVQVKVSVLESLCAAVQLPMCKCLCVSQNMRAQDRTRMGFAVCVPFFAYAFCSLVRGTPCVLYSVTEQQTLTNI